jgi:hypothetical protein
MAGRRQGDGTRSGGFAADFLIDDEEKRLMKHASVLLRKVRCGLPVSLLVTVCLGGCSRNVDEIAIDNPTVNIAGVATAVKEMLTLAKSNPALAPQHVKTALEVLDSAKDYDFGDHQSTYDQLVTGCEELKTLLDQSADASQINAKIDTLLSLVGQLPQLTPNLLQD